MLNVLPKEEQINSIFTSIERLIPSNTLLSCPDWAEQRRYMNSKITGRSGAFSFTNAPYCREICDCFSKNNPTQEVAIMKGVQLGLTTSVIENTIGYNMDINPSPMMFVFPNKDQAEEYKKKYESKFGPLLLTSNSLNAFPWAWNKNPWPWEKK